MPKSYALLKPESLLRLLEIRLYRPFNALKNRNPIINKARNAVKVPSSRSIALIRAVVILAVSILAPSATAHMLQTDDPSLLSLAKKSAFAWIARDDLPDDIQKKIPPGCNGLYIEKTPDVDSTTSKEALQNLDLIIEADKADVVDANKATLEGEVSVSQGNRSISAEKMTYDRNTEKATLESNVTIHQPGMLIHGEYAEVSTNEHKASFNEARFVLQENKVRGGAKAVRQVSETKLELIEGHITSCEPGDESWVLEGEKLTVDRESNLGTGRNVKLKIGSVPVFYLPYISFPVGEQRQTGFLFPSISSSDDGGIDISVPYYLNLAPNYDATITPRFISGRGTMLEFETRYLNRWMRSNTGFAFLPNDGGNQDSDIDRLIEEGEITEERARPNKGENRWLIQLEQEGGFTKGWYSRTNYTRVSDEDYFRDLGTSSLSVASSTFLEQSIEFGYNLQNWKISSLAQSQQVLLLDVRAPYRKIPQIDIDGRYNTSSLSFGDMTVSMKNRITQFRHRDDDPSILEGKRINTDYRLQWEKRYPWGFFSPELGHKALHYRLGNELFIDQNNQDNFTLSTPQASLDTGLIFDHSPGKFTQTIEPRLFYLYRRFVDHSKLFGLGEDGTANINFDTSERTFSYEQLYRDSRFIGGDRLDDAHQVTLGLTSRWNNNTSGRELFNVSVGQIFHLDDRRVSLGGNLSEEETTDSSEFASELKIFLGSNTEIYANALYDTESKRINRGSAGLNFASSDYQKILNLSYSFLRDQNNIDTSNVSNNDIDQVDLSFAYPVAKQWAVMGRANYDFKNDQELETFLGFEYNDCCYRLRFLARRWIDSNIANLVEDEDAQYDQGIFFEVHFKGLGGSGAKVNSILEDGIFGYESREELLH